MPNVAHALAKRGADVHVLMTKNATEFIAPLVFETLTNRRCIVDTFDRNFQYDVAHVSLANAADLMLIAPATANVIAKLGPRPGRRYAHDGHAGRDLPQTRPRRR